MNIRFGNLTVLQFADRVNAIFTHDEIELLEARRSNLAQDIPPDQFHIFDDPAVSVVLGPDAMDLIDIFTRANARRIFTREVGFYPVGK